MAGSLSNVTARQRRDGIIRKYKPIFDNRGIPLVTFFSLYS